MNIFELMAAPFAECMILVGIHTYLGIHVLRRRVIFVDLALAQTAALGTTVGFLFGLMPASPASLIFSITFTFIAAAIFALTRIRSDRIPQEAVIGLFYAIAAAVAILVVEKTKGAEHMESILVGGLLWVKWSDVITAAGAYSVIGVIHWVFRKQFRMISERPDEAYESGMNVRLWDFLFYLTFGLVISFSVRVAGVLLVFVFLVAPAIMAFLITDRMRYQLLIGWITGTVVTGAGLYTSYAVDFPSGPTVIASYGIVLVIGALIVYLIGAKRKSKAALKILLGSAVAALVGGGVWLLGTSLSGTSLAGDDHMHMHGASCEDDQEEEKVEKAESKEEMQAAAAEQKSEFQAMKEKAGVSVEDSVLVKFMEADDSDSRLEFIRALTETDEKTALALLICFLSDSETGEFFKSEGLDLFKEKAGEDFDYDPTLDEKANSRALEAMKKAVVAK